MPFRAARAVETRIRRRITLNIKESSEAQVERGQCYPPGSTAYCLEFSAKGSEISQAAWENGLPK